MISASIDMRLSTILIGDPNNPPVFKAVSGFSGDALIHGYDNAAGDPTTNFFVALKNIVIDSTNIAPGNTVTALGWGISQACHLTNIKINMPNNSKGHVGIDMSAGSATVVSDVVRQSLNSRNI
jgi:glucan 1,3-beta-glucosidase